MVWLHYLENEGAVLCSIAMSSGKSHLGKIQWSKNSDLSLGYSSWKDATNKFQQHAAKLIKKTVTMPGALANVAESQKRKI